MKKIKDKKCRVCNESFKPQKSTQIVCSPYCSVIYAKDKVKDKKLKELVGLENAKHEIQHEKSLKASLVNTKTQIHSYVRIRDKGKNCISCNAKWSETFQAGHFYSSNSFQTIKYNLDNIHGQCQHCNLRLEGNFQNYILRLPERIGQKRFEKVMQLASIDKQFSKYWDLESLKECRTMAKKGLIYLHEFQK